MSKYYLVEEESGLGIFTIDFILLFLLAMTCGLNLILAFFVTILASILLFLLMKIPVFGRIVVCACGCVVTYSLYSLIDLTGWLTKMHNNSPVQWWITVILSTLVIIALHWVQCPSPRSNGTILGDDDDVVGGYDYTPSNSAPQYTPTVKHVVFDKDNGFIDVDDKDDKNVKLDDVIGTFNATQSKYQRVKNEVNNYSYDTLPQEFLDISQNAENQYETLVNRMGAYMELFNDSEVSWRNEVGADILKKAEAANEAINRLESAFRLLNQTTENKDTNSAASFFRGCDTIDELNKRYRNLAKTFHPDLEAGDEETMKQVNEEYEHLKAEFTSNNL